MDPATCCGITELLATGGQVEASSVVRADAVALYFTAVLPPACRRFTRRLEEACVSWASPRSFEFEVVFVSCDDGEESFDAHLATMMPPAWHAVRPVLRLRAPGARALVARFNATGEVPRLVVVLDATTGEAVTERGVELVAEHGAAAYPFTPARVDELERGRAARERPDHPRRPRRAAVPGLRGLWQRRQGAHLPARGEARRRRVLHGGRLRSGGGVHAGAVGEEIP
uniref:protein-disulfide reductase n=1 Tax=Oryza meridionalis TaxID=40149 RepID=A0A0E0D1X9_9ORYZ